ncbi:sigma-70 family RNA polymerase sigma factor [Crocinitomicaceae bacterium]|nr:sigma-70 family RNA polymerase sigma factor [Crocinitomicaceae bacterium]
MKSEEELWVKQVVLGGADAENAFKAISVRYGPKLYAQIFRIIQNEAIAKDVLQNVFIKVWKNLSSFKQESNLYTWMYRIARNESLTTLATENKRSHLSIDTSVVQIIPGHKGLDTMTGNEIYQHLKKAIETLPEKQAIVFELKYFENQKYSEIAKITGTSEGALKASYHIAKEKITAFLKTKLNH